MESYLFSLVGSAKVLVIVYRFNKYKVAQVFFRLLVNTTVVNKHKQINFFVQIYKK